MEYEMYFRWYKGSENGTFMLGINGTTFKYRQLYGNAPSAVFVESLIVHYKNLRDAINMALNECPPRKAEYAFTSITGSSKCKDFYILTKVKKTLFTIRKRIWHVSMRDKLNEDMDIYVRDLVDWVEETWKGMKFSESKPVKLEQVPLFDGAEAVEIAPLHIWQNVKWNSPQMSINNIMM